MPSELEPCITPFSMALRPVFGPSRPRSADFLIKLSSYDVRMPFHAQSPNCRASCITCSSVSHYILKKKLDSMPNIRINEIKSTSLKKKKQRRCFPYSANVVSLNHNKRDARYKRLRSAIYRTPLFNSCTVYQIGFSIFLSV